MLISRLTLTAAIALCAKIPHYIKKSCSLQVYEYLIMKPNTEKHRYYWFRRKTFQIKDLDSPCKINR